MPSDFSQTLVSTPRILLIDDDALVRKNFSAFLSDSGYQVVEAESGSVGLEKALELRPNLVLCDIRLPDVDGIEVLKQLSCQGVSIPVIVISGVGRVGDAVQALRLGAADYLMKPIDDLEVLEHAVRRSLDMDVLEKMNANYSQQLEATNSQLRRSLDLLKVDQQAGRLVQSRLLPVSPHKLGAVSCEHLIIPSLYLSGDFVDYWQLTDGSLLFYIADVSGHGASSAFVTILLRYLMRDIVERMQSAGEPVDTGTVLSRLNSELCKANLQKHVTAFLGLIDAKSSELHYSVAGHYPMPIVGDDEGFRYLEGRSFPLGVQEQIDYGEQQTALRGSYSLTLVSDGVLELMPESSLDEKEQVLLNAVQANAGNFARLSEALQLERVSDAPDDVALLTISHSYI